MTFSSEEHWVITDEDLEGFQVEEPPRPKIDKPKVRCFKPVQLVTNPADRQYADEDWVYLYKQLTSDWSLTVDWAAEAAGIRIYDALEWLMDLDSDFYEDVVLRGIKPWTSDIHTVRRNRQVSGVSGYTGRESQLRSGVERDGGYKLTPEDRKELGIPEEKPLDAGKLTEEEARQRFLDMLGGRDPDKRVDGKPIHGMWGHRTGERAIDPRTGERKLKDRKPKEDKKIKEEPPQPVKKVPKKRSTGEAPYCALCEEFGHKMLECPPQTKTERVKKEKGAAHG